MGKIARLGVLMIAVLFGLALCLSTLRATGAAHRDESSSQGGTDASVLFGKSCATCHGKDGRAKTFKAKFNNARDLTDAAWQEGVSDERLFNSIMNGRGKSMPAFKKKFSREQVELLVAHVRALKK